MAVAIEGNKNNTIYGKGDICLRLNPFDNFRLFTLYDNWKNDDRKPLDLSNGQKLYIIFRSKNKEIRIPEYDLVDSDYKVDKVNGEVLFKISKKNAIDILAMKNNVFYITRTYDVMDSTGETVVSSDEEVLYTGCWQQEGTYEITDYTSQIKALTDIITSRDKDIELLKTSNASLSAENVELIDKLNQLQEENRKMLEELTEVRTKLMEYTEGDEYSGTVIGKADYTTIIESKKFTEEQMQEALKHLEEITKD